MTEAEFKELVHRLRKIHRGERRRAWWNGRVETLALGALFCGVAWLLWRDDNLEGVGFAILGALLAIAALV